MNPAEELIASWKIVPQLQKEIIKEAPTLETQAKLLENQINGSLNSAKISDDQERVELVAKLCLLSEICGTIDFDRMIKAREKFKEHLPDHFAQYLKQLDSVSWQITWSGCLECRHFLGKCNLGLTPKDELGDASHLTKHCPSKVKRSKNL